MAARRTSFGKLERDRAKRAKAMAKRERREERSAAPDDTAGDQEASSAADAPDATDAPEAPEVPEEQVIAKIQALHERFDDGGMSFDEFEEQKQKLLDRLSVD